MKPRGAMAAQRWSCYAAHLPAPYPGCWHNARFRQAYNRAWMRAHRGQAGDSSPPHPGVRLPDRGYLDARHLTALRRRLQQRDANLYAWRPAGFVCRAETTEAA